MRNNDLELNIRNIIDQAGYINIDHFLSIVIPFYYQYQTSLGHDGDFITAPESSQMFGEMLGIFAANHILQLNKMPQKIAIVELGPGNGLLMADFLRATSHIKELNLKKIVLFEASTTLQAKQKLALAQYNDRCIWPRNIEEMQQELEEHYCIFIANEFFDALPIKQFQMIDGNIFERYIDFDGQFTIKRYLEPCKLELLYKRDGIVEYCSQMPIYVEIIANALNNSDGMAIIVDYGYLEANMQSTLQAIHRHKSVDIFDHLGEADITALVDFQRLAKLLKSHNLNVIITTQSSFLQDCGILARAEALIRYGKNAKQVRGELEILLSPEKMGELFKVLVAFKKAY